MPKTYSISFEVGTVILAVCDYLSKLHPEHLHVVVGSHATGEEPPHKDIVLPVSTLDGERGAQSTARQIFKNLFCGIPQTVGHLFLQKMIMHI